MIPVSHQCTSGIIEGRDNIKGERKGDTLWRSHSLPTASVGWLSNFCTLLLSQDSWLSYFSTGLFLYFMQVICMLIASNCPEWENEAIFRNALCGNERWTWVRYVATTNQMRTFNMNLSWISNCPPQYFFRTLQSTLFFLVNCLYKEAIWLDEG